MLTRKRLRATAIVLTIQRPSAAGPSGCMHSAKSSACSYDFIVANEPYSLILYHVQKQAVLSFVRILCAIVPSRTSYSWEDVYAAGGHGLFFFLFFFPKKKKGGWDTHKQARLPRHGISNLPPVLYED